jgi:hypothetical protein
MYTRHEERTAAINGTADQVFAALDDPTRLTSHMSEPSWRMGGGKMETILDAEHGQRVGSHIILKGRVFGVRLFVEEVVISRRPPSGKAWETIGVPRLLVVGPYRMSFDVTSSGPSAQLRVAIDYDLPANGLGRILGSLFGRLYARWCVRQMTEDAVELFARSPVAA